MNLPTRLRSATARNARWGGSRLDSSKSWLFGLPKVISEMVVIPCRESWQTGRFAPPFRKLLLAIALTPALLGVLFLSGCIPHERRADLVIVNGAEPESLDPAIIVGV